LLAFEEINTPVIMEETMSTRLPCHLIAFAVLFLGAGGQVAASPVTYHCPDGVTWVVDLAKHKFAWINAQGVDETSTQGRVRFEGRYVTYGIGLVQPVTIDTATGHFTVYSTGEGAHFDGDTCPPSKK
jgi:hypothetical protein